MRKTSRISKRIPLLVAAYIAAAAFPASAVEFAYEVRPILAKRCFECHGPDEGHRKAELRLDTREGIFGPAQKVGRIVVPKNPGDSELVYRITTGDEDERMPPADHGPRLSPNEVAAITRWVEEGGDWSDHWSFEPLERPDLPPVGNRNWPINGLDYFVLARLEKEGLSPSPDADRNTLVRRVSLDLIGLPPSWQDVQKFANDPSPDAYERMVDRMLASPRYGERWARVWLDLARYSDTKGYEKDLTRTIWRYRDWVVDAFNRDLPYDRFTAEQLGGDLIPDATLEQRLATAFHRNTMTNDEGGTDNEEFRVEAVRDRVDTTMQVWMGLTMGCAKCHDHKFDPISTKEYYSFFAFFNQTKDADTFTDIPLMEAPTDEQNARLAEIDAEITLYQKKIDALAAKTEAKEGAKRWEEARKALELKPPVPDDVKKALDVDPASRTDDQRHVLAAHYVRTESEEGAPIREALEELEKRKEAIEIPKIPIMEELPEDQLRTTHVMERGNFLSPGEEVAPEVPDRFHAFPNDAPRNRLGLSKWLMAPENPLTARVAVNRHWGQFFGRGIVETEEDFGSQGMLPTHPKLLDWLAVEFRENGWSFKALCKTVVMSATYRQSSNASHDVLRRDPHNLLFARGPRVRLEAEAIRDNALAVAGLLSGKMYGPSVMPPQPDGIWRSTYNQTTWETSEGEDRYRRGLYTFHKRTSPYPSMLTFDAPTREWCTIRRIRSNTPLQALVTLNDPVYVEAAQAFARNIIERGGETDEQRIAYAFRRAVARDPNAFETAEIKKLLDRRLAFYAQHPGDAVNMSTEPLGPLPEGIDPVEAAAWTAVCNVILNLDEVQTKG